MKQIIPHITLFSFLLFACGGQTGKKTTDTPPAGDYNEVLYQYENHYRPDGLLDKVTERTFSVARDILLSNGVAEYVYTHTLNDDKPARMEKCRLMENGSRSNPEITVYLPDGYVTFTLEGRDTVQYEEVLRNARGEIIYEKNYSRGISIAEFDFDAPGQFSEISNTYDSLNRLTGYYWLHIFNKDTLRQRKTITYNGNSEEIVSEQWESLSHPEQSHTIVYRTEQYGDTLVQYGYHDDQLKTTLKTLPGYHSEITYEDDKSIAFVKTKIDRNGSRIEITRDSHTTDSLYYQGDLLMREVRISPEMHTIDEYEYDQHQNINSHRQKATFYLSDL